MESVEALEVFSSSSARYRYRVPVAILRELQYEGSRYSAEFEVGGWLWRFHIQERFVGDERFLALHLQSCSPGAIPVHFKLSVVCMRDPLLSKSKTFHCTFKKAGSAWGLHQFIPMQELLSAESGFVYTVEETGTRCIDFEVTLQVQGGASSESRNGMMNSVPPDRSVTRSVSASRRPPAPYSGGGSSPRGSPYRGMSAPAPGSGGGGYPLPPPPPSLLQQQQQHGNMGGGGAPYGNRSSSPGAGPIVTAEGSVDRRSISRPGYGSGGRGYGGGPNSNNNELMVLGGGGGGGGAPDGGNAMAGPGGGMLTTHSGSGGGAVLRPSYPSNYARAPLTYPFEHLETLCDMSFDVQGVRVKAHRCVIGARMRPLLPEQMLPLQAGCIVAIAVPLDVFTTFLRYVYTEETPEQGVLPAESLLDLYLLSAACEFYDLSAICLQYVRPLLTPDNILPIVLTRYNAADDVLTSLYLHVLLEHYDVLIQDKQFEEIPGHLFRRLSLILYRKESVPHTPIPAMKNTLGKQLTWLAETGEYSDFEWVVGPQQYAVRAHKYILACRSVAFSQAVNPRNPAPLPVFTSPDFDFTLRCWQKLLSAMYRRHLDTNRDFSAEDIAIIFKMQTVLGMDGHLKREADEAFSNANALRLLIYAVKHQIPELHERAIAYVASNFTQLIRSDPQAWELISELPQAAVVALFRTVTEHL